ncbi:carbamoyl-phosphate synthase [Cytobacillus sp. IB215665]|uniref:carboxylate--amine ligase n=1 Tax=Cytobacillus sp. IB215665 TaxID=3097357 RepID=UPI002A129BAE|nr:carbamoyl-phosphate synthase [Cytobacillus sp. IB215665]MDX8364506.1 carbamoyl-phosphate synthase [Cytobacillus sp. IB215665]
MVERKHPAIVLDLSANGIGIVRSLGRKGVDVYAFDTGKKYKIGKTCYATCKGCPDPIKDEEGLLTFLLNLGKTFCCKAVLYAGSDDFLYFMSKHREILSMYYLFLLPEHTTVHALIDKRLTYELATKHNIPCPTTFFLDKEEELEGILNKLTFPCIIKPVYGHKFRQHINKKIIMVHSAEQLKATFPYYRQFGELMLQEFIPGDDSTFYKLATFLDEDMNVKALFTLQKLHQFPPNMGTGALIISKRDEEIIDVGLPFLKELECKGVSMAEFKKDPRDGELKFIEINSRLWLSHSLTEACGIDFAYLYYLYLTGQDPEPRLYQIEDIKWIYLVRYYLAYLHKKEHGEMTFYDFKKGLTGNKQYALFAWDDPMPFLRSAFSHLYNSWKTKKQEENT